MLVDGAKDETIARTLGISLRTCRRHAATIMSALTSTSRFQAGYRLGRASAMADMLCQQIPAADSAAALGRAQPSRTAARSNGQSAGWGNGVKDAGAPHPSAGTPPASAVTGWCRGRGSRR